MSLRTPLFRVRDLGSAHSGVEHWGAQRLTAVALAPLSLWLGFSLAGLAGADHASIVGWMRKPHVSVALLLLVPIVFYHAQLGLQVVIEDYVHSAPLRVSSLVLLKLVSAVLALAGVFFVLRISLG
jgi:succinate dehydrogenase / fumarate reductase membrane anchor subunit